MANLLHLFCTIDLLVHNYTAYADLCQPDMVVQMFPRVIWWLDILFVLSFFLQVLVFSLRIPSCILCRLSGGAVLCMQTFRNSSSFSSL